MSSGSALWDMMQQRAADEARQRTQGAASSASSWEAQQAEKERAAARAQGLQRGTLFDPGSSAGSMTSASSNPMANRIRDFGGFSGAAGKFAPLYSSGGALDDEAQANEAELSQQRDALGLLRDAAYGNTPSKAQLMMKSGLDDVTRNQQSMAASARGPMAMAMAQQRAAENSALAGTQTANQMAQLRADEMARARGEYFGGVQNIRGMNLQDEQANRGFDIADYNAQTGRIGTVGGLARGFAGDAAAEREAQLKAWLEEQKNLAAGHGTAQGANATSANNTANNSSNQVTTMVTEAGKNTSMPPTGGGS